MCMHIIKNRDGNCDRNIFSYSRWFESSGKLYKVVALVPLKILC